MLLYLPNLSKINKFIQKYIYFNWNHDFELFVIIS